jgi:hypothetical protein
MRPVKGAETDMHDAGFQPCAVIARPQDIRGKRRQSAIDETAAHSPSLATTVMSIMKPSLRLRITAPNLINLPGMVVC